jgi:hypothetical protein
MTSSVEARWRALEELDAMIEAAIRKVRTEDGDPAIEQFYVDEYHRIAEEQLALIDEAIMDLPPEEFRRMAAIFEEMRVGDDPLFTSPPTERPNDSLAKH